MTKETKAGLTTQQVAARFDELAQQEKWFEIHDELFADQVSKVEQSIKENQLKPSCYMLPF